MIIIFDIVNITSKAFTTKSNAGKSIDLSLWQVNELLKSKKLHKKRYYITTCELIKDKNKARKNGFL